MFKLTLDSRSIDAEVSHQVSSGQPDQVDGALSVHSGGGIEDFEGIGPDGQPGVSHGLASEERRAAHDHFDAWIIYELAVFEEEVTDGRAAPSNEFPVGGSGFGDRGKEAPQKEGFKAPYSPRSVDPGVKCFFASLRGFQGRCRAGNQLTIAHTSKGLGIDVGASKTNPNASVNS